MRDWRRIGLEIGGEDLIAAGIEPGPPIGAGLHGCPRSQARRRARAAGARRSSRPRSRSPRGGDLRSSSAMRWSDDRRTPLARGRPARRPGRVLDPASAASATGPFESLNLGVLTDDEPESVRREPPAAQRRARPRSRARRDRAPGPRRPRSRATTAPQESESLGRARPASPRSVDGHVHRPARTSRRWCSSPTACRSRSPAPAASRCCTAAGAGSRRDRRRRGRRGRRRRRRRSAPGSGPAATRSARRCSPRSPRSATGLADGPHARPAGGRPAPARAGRRRPRSRTPGSAPAANPTCSSPTAASGPETGPAGGDRLDGRCGLMVEPFRDIDPGAGRAPTSPRSGRSCRHRIEILVACKYVPLEEMGRSGRGRGRAGRREPPRRPRGKARALGRLVRLGLHRQPAEPQGQGRPAARAADPLGRTPRA